VREAMYDHARSLNCLRNLSCFLFDRFMLAFEAAPGGRVCRIGSSVREMLCNLDNIIFSLRDPPALPLFESLFVDELETRVGEPGFNMEREMALLLSRAEKALSTIRRFSRRIPLTRIIRVATRNMGYSPARTGGAEDWFQVYRGYWRQQASATVAEHFTERKRQEIIAAVAEAFGAKPRPLANAASKTNPGGFRLPEAFALSVLRAFHSGRFGGIEAAVEPVLDRGEFTRLEDSGALNTAMADVASAADRIRRLDEKIAPDGEHGRRHALVRQETDAPVAKRRKILFVQNEASEEARSIIAFCSDGMGRLAAMLDAVAGKSGAQPCLANFAQLAGKNPAAFGESLVKAAGDLRLAMQLLHEICTMEEDG